MNPWMLWAIAGLYGYAAIKAFLTGAYFHGIMFAGYAAAGVAVIYTLPES